MYGYLRDAYDDMGVFSVNPFRFERLMMGMANRGEWRPAFEFLSEAIARQTGIRDYIGGEKVIQGFLAAYLSVTAYYVFRSEAELGRDMPTSRWSRSSPVNPHLRRGYLIELKYLKRGRCGGGGPRRRGSAGSGQPVGALRHRRAAGAAIPGGAVHRLGLSRTCSRSSPRSSRCRCSCATRTGCSRRRRETAPAARRSRKVGSG